MAQSLGKIKRRIGMVKSTTKLTSTMKLVSNVKMMQTKKQLQANKNYFDNLKLVYNDIIFHNKFNFDSNIESKFLKENDGINSILYIVFTSDLGLCGSYNLDTFKELKKIYKNGDEVIIIGEKGAIELGQNTNINGNLKFVSLYKKDEHYLLEKLLYKIKNDFITKRVKKVCIVHHSYINSLVSVVKTSQILPILIENNDNNRYDPSYFPSKDDLINEIVEAYLESEIIKIIKETQLSEYNARRNAMENADKNAKDMLDALKKEYDKSRQQEITQEITEVVSGSLKDDIKGGI